MSTWETPASVSDAHVAQVDVRGLIVEGQRNGRIAAHLAAYILAELEREGERAGEATQLPERGRLAPARAALSAW